MTAGGILAVAGRDGRFHHRRHKALPAATSTFPYGLYKIENIFATVVGVILLVLAYELARLSIKHLGGVHVLTSDPKYALPFFLGAALLAGGMGYYKQRVAKAEGCPSLRADSYFSLADGVAMVIIGAALAIDIAGYHKVDAIAGMIVACFLAFIGYNLPRRFKGLARRVGRPRPPRQGVKRRGGDPGVRKVLSVDGRNSGSFIFLHLVVEPAAYDLSRRAGYPASSSAASRPPSQTSTA